MRHVFRCMPRCSVRGNALVCGGRGILLTWKILCAASPERFDRSKFGSLIRPMQRAGASAWASAQHS
jgi:hypothetical protein